jgi:hypothetical protein
MLQSKLSLSFRKNSKPTPPGPSSPTLLKIKKISKIYHVNYPTKCYGSSLQFLKIKNKNAKNLLMRNGWKKMMTVVSLRRSQSTEEGGSKRE